MSKHKFHPRDELRVFWPLGVTEMNGEKGEKDWWQRMVVGKAKGKGCFVRLTSRNWLGRTECGWGNYLLTVLGPEKMTILDFIRNEFYEKIWVGDGKSPPVGRVNETDVHAYRPAHKPLPQDEQRIRARSPAPRGKECTEQIRLRSRRRGGSRKSGGGGGEPAPREGGDKTDVTFELPGGWTYKIQGTSGAVAVTETASVGAKAEGGGGGRGTAKGRGETRPSGAASESEAASGSGGGGGGASGSGGGGAASEGGAKAEGGGGAKVQGGGGEGGTAEDRGETRSSDSEKVAAEGLGKLNI